MTRNEIICSVSFHTGPMGCTISNSFACHRKNTTGNDRYHIFRRCGMNGFLANETRMTTETRMRLALFSFSETGRLNHTRNHAACSAYSISKYLVESAFILLCDKFPVVVSSDYVQIVLPGPVFVFL